MGLKVNEALKGFLPKLQGAACACPGGLSESRPSPYPQEEPGNVP